MIYRKSGTTVRWEHGTLITVRESGEAREIGAEFMAEPCGSREATQVSTAEILRFAQDDVAALPLERLVITEGHAIHECGEQRWEERQRRLHLSITGNRHRALIDRADFDIDSIAAIAKALANMRGEREVERLRLAPNVAAAILPSLIGMIDIEQLPAPHDGYGAPIAQCRVVADVLPPNFYRPSYRIRPIRAWHNLRAIPFGEFEDAPRAIALLAPPDERVLRVLCVDGSDSFSATVHVTQVRAVGAAERWYPYAAGAFGAEMLL